MNIINNYMNNIKKVQIYGERCSGTNYLEELLMINFNVEIIWDYGWKHFFGHNDLSNSNDVLFIGIVRNLDDWINSLYREKHHLYIKHEDTLNDEEKLNHYLNSEHYSIDHNENNIEIMEDRNMYTKERYSNIFELRHIKNKYLIETLPTLVKNYCLIIHDNLINDFVNVMNNIKNNNLEIKQNIEFPLNITYYKKEKDIQFIKKENTISNEIIIEKANLFYEKILFPDLY